MPSDVLVLGADHMLPPRPKPGDTLILDEQYEPRRPATGHVLLSSSRTGIFWGFTGLLLLSAAVMLVFQLPNKRAQPARSPEEIAALEATPRPKAFPMIAPLAEDPQDAQDRNEAIPIDRSALMSAAPFRSGLSGVALTRARDCLAVAGWYEVGADSAGQKGVMQVILNRVRHPSFPDTVCGVVFQGAERRTGCQFTFTCDGSMLRRRPSEAALTLARTRADTMLGGEVMPDVGTATHYHADYVQPVWARQLVKIAILDRHLFYRWPGPWGDRMALKRTPLSAEPQVAALAWAGGEDSRDLDQLVIPDDLAPAAIQPLSLANVAVGTAKTNEVSAQVMVLDTSKPAGRFAVDALSHCADKPRCYVAGWLGRTGQGAVPLAQLKATPPDFLFFKQGRSRTSKAYWNCAAFKRSDPEQCLPNAAGVAALLSGSRG
ncbi:cell wall hydrolase [Qipengyuania qiaonensis]|uniref:Cell wall hydrolase n=1 Tax=Qipengyuania qiaonensis TaxID=2867240 RepID=A0ABS7JD91_9SPHN|nr:cell wall hydrolase [Qipengyuania qiaonensis]MBX7483658.1 cell wall hydrolase [Qipengyuania qiaonensis]